MFASKEFAHIYRSFDEAFDWRPEDPRLERLADDVTALLLKLEPPAPAADVRIDDTVVAMLDARSLGASPAWRRLAELLGQRGWAE